MFNLSNPLEQFQLVPLISIQIGNLDLSFTNSTFFIIWSLGVFLLLVYLSTLNGGGSIIPNRWQLIIENIYAVVLGIALDNIGVKTGLRFFPIVFVLFIFILCLNLIGIVPYRFTVTRHLVVTLSLSLGVFLGRTYIIVREHQIEAFGFFLPAGTPLALIPLLVIIEVVSYFITVVRLSVRLFANIISGHILLKVLIGFAWTIITAGRAILFIAHILPLGIVFLLIGLELAVSVIQAYVFSVLTCIYINDAINLH